MYSNMFGQGLEETIMKNTGWSKPYFYTVDWAAHEAVLRSYSRQKRISIGKCVHGLWHTGAQKELYGMDKEGLCPCCLQLQETVTHVYQCEEPTVVNHRTKLLKEFEQKCVKRNIPVPVFTCIIQGLTWLLQDSSSAVPIPIPNTVGHILQREVIARNAFHAQTTLGWEQGLRGRLSKAWNQALLYNLTGDNREETADMMVRWMIKQLLQLSMAIWEFRNGILHGVTKEEQQQKFTQLLHQQVRDAFSYYSEKPSIV